MADFVIEARKRKEYEQFTCRIEADLLEKIEQYLDEYDNWFPNKKSRLWENKLINGFLIYTVGFVK